MTQKPSLGRIVIVDGLSPLINNGASRAPAIITRVWSDALVNLTVVLDSGTTLHRTSVALHETAEAFAERAAEVTDHLGAYWPPRV